MDKDQDKKKRQEFYDRVASGEFGEDAQFALSNVYSHSTTDVLQDVRRLLDAAFKFGGKQSDATAPPVTSTDTPSHRPYPSPFDGDGSLL